MVESNKKKNFTGKGIVVSAPSGAGKTTIVKHLLSDTPDLVFSISACSRPKRGNEENGKDYYFISAEEFKKKIKNDEFLEWEEVYPDHFYGSLKSEVERIWTTGRHVIFDVDVVGGLNIKKYYAERTLALFVMPPSEKELEKRLKKRSTESADSLKERISKATYELSFADCFDEVIINDKLESALIRAKTVVTDFLKHK